MIDTSLGLNEVKVRAGNIVPLSRNLTLKKRKRDESLEELRGTEWRHFLFVLFLTTVEIWVSISWEGRKMEPGEIEGWGDKKNSIPEQEESAEAQSCLEVFG